MKKQTTHESFEACYARASAWWNTYLATPTSGGVLRQVDLARGIAVSMSRARQILLHATQVGALVRRGGRLGFILPDATGPAAHLGAVLAAAREAVDPAHAPRRGRQPTDRLVPVDRLSPSQFDKMAAAASIVAWGLGLRKEELHRIGPEHFAWEPALDAREGERRGTFSLVERVAEWSDAKARAEHGGAGWHRDMNVDARAAHLAGIRLLLNFAATRGWVRYTDAPAGPLGTYAAPWQAWIEIHAAELQAVATNATGRWGCLDGCRLLARFATAAGAPSPERVDWSAVIRSIEQATFSEGGTLKRARFNSAKSTYRRLRASGVIVGPPWGTERRSPHGAATGAAFKAAVEQGDFAGWPSWLVNGHYGLRHWYRWVHENTTPSDLARLGLPPRAYVEPTQEQLARQEAALRERRNLFQCQPTTLERYLRNVSSLAGYIAARRAPADADRMGLVVLCDTTLLDEYSGWWCATHERDPKEQERAPWLHGMGKTLSLIASPFLEARARQAGDTALAARLRGASRELFAWAKRHQPPRAQIASAGTRVRPWQADGGAAYDKLRAIRDRIAADVERLGGMSVGAQIAAVTAGTFQCRRPADWAIAVRDALVFTLQLRLPLRARNVCALTLPSRRGAPDGTFRHTGEQPWLGALSADFRKMKNGEPYEGPIIIAGEVGRADAEADLRRDLWQLWLMAGGARDEMRTLVPATDGRRAVLCETPVLFPAYARYGTPERRAKRAKAGLVLRPTSLLRAVKHRMLAHGAAVGLDVPAALTAYGSLGEHFFRHALATWADEHGETANAARLLAHKQRGSVIQAHYTSQDAMRVSIDAMRRRAAGREATGVSAPPKLPLATPGREGQGGEHDELVARLAGLVAAGTLSPEAFRSALAAMLGRAS